MNTFQSAMSTWWTTASASISNAVTDASNIVRDMITNMNNRDSATDAGMGQQLQTLVSSVTGADTSATSTACNDHFSIDRHFSAVSQVELGFPESTLRGIWRAFRKRA